MLRPDGYVKVLDFGLAKLSEQASPAVAAEAPTIQVRTGSGIVIGTAGYMSPEQARGLGVDHRSDIFSLGAVIYEMLARRKPFEGETPSDTLAAILKDRAAAAFRVFRRPAELTRIVNKSLKKDREERYQVVKDLWLDLKALKQEFEFQTSSTLVREGGATATMAGRTDGGLFRTTTDSRTQRHQHDHRIAQYRDQAAQVRRRARLLVVLLSSAAGGFGVYKLLNRESAVGAFLGIDLTRLTNSGNAIDATISPDGKYIVYVLSDRSSQSL